MVSLVQIETGEIDPTTPGNTVPKSKWLDLLNARGSYCSRQFQHDCKELLFFIEDGRKNQFFGFPDEITYWREGLCLEPEAVPFAEQYLRVRKARLEASVDGRDWREIPFDVAVKLGKREIGKGKPGPGRGNKTGANNARLSRSPCSPAYVVARLDRDGFEELAGKVRAGKISANAAAIAAGFRKKPKHKCPSCGHEWRG